MKMPDLTYDVEKREVIRCFVREKNRTGGGYIRRPLPFQFVKDSHSTTFDIEPINDANCQDANQSGTPRGKERIVGQEVYDSKPAWMSNVTDFGWI
jgi:hypothetical protein